jgi:phage/plasmid-associated DNA primase
VQEAPTQRVWRSELLTRLTGEDELVGRYLYQQSFTFHPTHHLWLVANDLPELEHVGPAVKRRLRIVPFTADFLGREDPDLGEKLAGALGEVLDWIVRGAVEWWKRGLSDVPEACRMAAEEMEMVLDDDVSRWAMERLEVREKEREAIPTTRLYQDYRRWALVNDGEELTLRQFGRRFARLMRDEGWRVRLVRSATERGWRGLALR